MKKIFFCFMIASLWFTTKGYCQKIDNNKLEQTITEALKKAYPACVKIFAYDTVAKQQAGGQFSGVVVSRDGYILTAAHVATPRLVYKVIFSDGKECLAVGLGKIEFAEDKTRPDAAMLKIISRDSWPYAPMASSSALKVYELCISLSYPESLYQPKPILRFGYISVIKNERGFIKSTCIMEPGDSGGPLFDLLGRVIGIHSAIEIPEEDNYDVPVDVYIKYCTALKAPKVYTALPEIAGTIPNDSLRRDIVSMPGLENNNAFNAIRSNFNKNCLSITSTVAGKEQKAIGTIFSLKGAKFKATINEHVIISKSSLIGEHPFILYKGNRQFSARIVARDKENDLVLIEPDIKITGGINYKQLNKNKSSTIRAGIFLVSAQPDTAGVISVAGSSLFSLPKISNSPFLGIGFKTRTAPLIVSYIFPNLNKSIYKLKIGDEILKVNSDTSTSFESVFKGIGHYWPGDTIQLGIRRSGAVLTENIVLDTLPQRHFDHPAEKFSGGKSVRRDGFNNVFTHDAIITPYQCGGPVFDLNGNFYGLNIARYSRTSCLAIPAITVYNFINSTLDGNYRFKTK